MRLFQNSLREGKKNTKEKSNLKETSFTNHRIFLKISLENIRKFWLRSLFLFLALFANGILSGLFVKLIKDLLQNQNKEVIFLLVIRSYQNISIGHIKNIILYPILNSIIMDSKTYSLESFLNRSSNKSTKDQLGKQERISSNIYSVINVYTSAFVTIISLIVQVKLMYKTNSAYILFLGLFIYYAAFLKTVKTWSSVLSSAYKASDDVSYSSLSAMEYKRNFEGNTKLFDSEIKKKMSKENKIYILKNKYIRYKSIILNIEPYVFLLLWIKFISSTSTTKEIIAYSTSGVFLIETCIRLANQGRFAFQLMRSFNLAENSLSKKKEELVIKSIYLNRVSIEKEKTLILKDFNLEIPNNSWIVVSGSNGSGKTTLCEIISGQLLPTSGEIIADIETSGIEKNISKDKGNDQGKIKLNNENKYLWSSNFIIKEGKLKLFDSEKKLLKQSEIINLHFSSLLDNSSFLDKKKYSTGEENFLSIVSSIFNTNNLYKPKALQNIQKPNMQNKENTKVQRKPNIQAYHNNANHEPSSSKSTIQTKHMIILDECLEFLDENLAKEVIKFLMLHYNSGIIISRRFEKMLSSELGFKKVTLHKDM
ncbi:ATP-binding cassette domain-containing protein [Candidatus Nesciobacter abundans]|uniref:ABC transporter ATP-binding protein n=1 Tax=Candidatus Nesciobacter abundans TaxID=2601668 RepID=A0A5C0UHI8_9PROT|nr:ATP-binding cassette domain-containing protein [Candidatus Nesciobacter abundans]QEK39239.1 ABC transporter ATP-binding protein [Candidatus Nesciobacter abundans]